MRRIHKKIAYRAGKESWPSRNFLALLLRSGAPEATRLTELGVNVSSFDGDRTENIKQGSICRNLQVEIEGAMHQYPRTADKRG